MYKVNEYDTNNELIQTVSAGLPEQRANDIAEKMNIVCEELGNKFVVKKDYGEV